MKLYLHQNGENVGPYTEYQIVSMVESGTLSREDVVWHEGLTEWQPIHTVVSLPTKIMDAPPVPPRPSKETALKETATVGDAVIQIVREFSTKIRDSHVYFAPDIPRKKLDAVLKSYAEGVAKEDALVLIDNTVFGGAKDGLLMTPTTLYVHNQMKEPEHIDLVDIENVAFTEGLTSVLHINDAKFLEINMPEKDAIRRFADMLREIVSKRHPGTPERSPVEALKQLKELLDSGIITDTEYEEKRKNYLDQL